MPKIFQIVEAIETRLPLTAAEPWDSVGFICGDKKSTFKGAVIGVDLTETLLAEAEKTSANLIVIHHPPLFPKNRGISRLVVKEGNDLSSLLLRCFQKKICVYVAHTNFDRCALDGMMRLAHDLGAEATARIWETPEKGHHLVKKLVTYIPADHFEKVRDALYEVGCGHIGNYDSCGFASAGIGNFRALSGATPFMGQVGERESVDEIRFETLVVSGLESIAVETLKFAHPYEEVAYDLYPVEQMPPGLGMIWGLGYGFVAELSAPISYEAFIKRVKKVFQVERFLSNQLTPKLVKKIAFTPGKGTSFVSAVKAHEVQVYITGEVGYHASIDAAKSGLNVLELGHRESELYFLKTFSAWFKEWALPAKMVDERTQRFV